MDRKSYIGKAEPQDILCHGIKCSIRDRCRRYNLEPNKDQKFIEPQVFGVRGVTIFCSFLEPLNEIKGEPNE
jgi:hypothetical protein